MHHLDVNKLDKCKPKARHGNFILDDNNSFHTLGALFADSRGVPHSLMDRLRTRQRIETSEKQNWCLDVSDIACTIIHVLADSTALFVRGSALGIIDLDTPTIVGSTCFDRLAECRCGRCTVRSRGRHLDERKQRVHKCTGMFRACELGKSKALRDTFENPTVGETSMRVQKQIRMGKCLMISLG